MTSCIYDSTHSEDHIFQVLVLPCGEVGAREDEKIFDRSKDALNH